MTARLAPQWLPQAPATAACAPIVLLGGWGMRAGALAELAASLGASALLELPAPVDADLASQRAELHAWLSANVAPGSVLIGWSLGGALAIDYAAAHPGRLAALVTLATNPCFCRRADWPHGMDEDEFARFRNALECEPAAQLQRFAALQARGDAAARAVLRRLRAELADVEQPDALLRGLALLGALDLRAALARLDLPTLHLLGSLDALVPGAVAGEYARLQPAASVWCVAGSAHAPFLSRPGAVAARIRDFLRVRHGVALPSRDKRAVARSFARAANGYDAAAELQRDSGRALLELAPQELDVQRALDLGCGTGAMLGPLAARFPGAHWIAADVADGMLRAMRARAPRTLGCGADAEALPFADGSFDLVFSNLVLQWCERPQAVFAELQRVLRPGAVALLCVPGPDSLWELRAAWRALDAGAHVHRFEEPERLLALARGAGLEVARVKRVWRVERHRSAREVAAGLRRLGAHNLDPARRRGLTGKQAWQRLEPAYAELGDDGPGLPATWQLLHLVLEKPRG